MASIVLEAPVLFGEMICHLQPCMNITQKQQICVWAYSYIRVCMCCLCFFNMNIFQQMDETRWFWEIRTHVVPEIIFRVASHFTRTQMVDIGKLCQLESHGHTSCTYAGARGSWDWWKSIAANEFGTGNSARILAIPGCHCKRCKMPGSNWDFFVRRKCNFAISLN